MAKRTTGFTPNIFILACSSETWSNGAPKSPDCCEGESSWLDMMKLRFDIDFWNLTLQRTNVDWFIFPAVLGWCFPKLRISLAFQVHKKRRTGISFALECVYATHLLFSPLHRTLMFPSQSCYTLLLVHNRLGLIPQPCEIIWFVLPNILTCTLKQWLIKPVPIPILAPCCLWLPLQPDHIRQPSCWWTCGSKPTGLSSLRIQIIHC